MSPGILEQKSESALGIVSLKIFKFFASLRLAILVLVSLMIVFAAGTIIESLHGTEAAALIIYQSPWFYALLFLLGVNLTASALDRLPWQKKHIGFVITHLGIILILIGSFVTRKLMVDGQMILAEGETGYQISLPEPVLYFYSQEQKQEWEIPLKKYPFPWAGQKNLAAKSQNLPFQISLITYYPKSRREENLIEAPEGPAALKVTLSNSFLRQEQWLVENHTSLGEVQVGPAKLRFANELLPENQNPAPESGYLEFQFQKSTVTIPLTPNLKLPLKQSLKGTPYQITILTLFKNATVVDNQLIEQSSEGGENPAVQLMLEGEGIQEKHTTFAKYPDFPTMHGMKPSAAGVHIFYRLPGGGSRGQSHELRFVKQPEGLFYQIQTGLNVKTGKVVLGEGINTGWMDLVFNVGTFYPHSEMRQTFSPEPNTSQSTEIRSAIQLEIQKEDDKKQIWLFQGFRSNLEWQGHHYDLIYGQRQKPLGFRLQLRDFKIERYPGTENPASFESDVTLKDDARGVQRDVTISMNQPLIYQGYRIYQAGYSQAEGQPEISIFAIGRDPGVPVKYLGAIVMIAGMIIMFSMRRFSPSGEKIT